MKTEHYETPQHYVVEEKVYGFKETKTRIIRRTKDLEQLQIDDDPWRKADKDSINWFKKYDLEKCRADFRG